MRLVLIGPPGSGKGTQGELLAEKFGVPHISTGEMIRDLVDSGSAESLRYKGLIDSGNFIPDSDMLEILVSRLAKPDAAQGYVLDGFPRDITQATLFDRTAAGPKLDTAVELRIDEMTLIARLAGRLVCPACGTSYHQGLQPPLSAGICDRDGTKLERRADDEPESVKRRLAVYRHRTQPLLDHYRRQRKLIAVEAAAAPDEVFRRLMVLLLSESPESQNAKV